MVRSAVCRVSRPWARRVAVDGRDHAPLVGRHAGHCLRCQAAAAVERRIGRALASMEDNLLMAPPGLMAAVMDSLEAPPARSEGGESGGAEKVVIAAAVVGAASLMAWTLTRRTRSGF